MRATFTALLAAAFRFPARVRERARIERPGVSEASPIGSGLAGSGILLRVLALPSLAVSVSVPSAPYLEIATNDRGDIE